MWLFDAALTNRHLAWHSVATSVCRDYFTPNIRVEGSIMCVMKCMTIYGFNIFNILWYQEQWDDSYDFFVYFLGPVHYRYYRYIPTEHMMNMYEWIKILLNFRRQCYTMKNWNSSDGLPARSCVSDLDSVIALSRNGRVFHSVTIFPLKRVIHVLAKSQMTFLSHWTSSIWLVNNIQHLGTFSKPVCRIKTIRR